MGSKNKLENNHQNNTQSMPPQNQVSIRSRTTAMPRDQLPVSLTPTVRLKRLISQSPMGERSAITKPIMAPAKAVHRLAASRSIARAHTKPTPLREPKMSAPARPAQDFLWAEMRASSWLCRPSPNEIAPEIGQPDCGQGGVNNQPPAICAGAQSRSGNYRSIQVK